MSVFERRGRGAGGAGGEGPAGRAVPGPGRGRPRWQSLREGWERAVRWGYHAPGILYDVPGPGQYNEKEGGWFYPNPSKEALMVFEEKEESRDRDFFDATRGYLWPGSEPRYANIGGFQGTPGQLSFDPPDLYDESEFPRRRRPPWERRRPETSYYDAALFNHVVTMTRWNVWYYRDRLSTPRGPAPLTTLRQAWTNGVIDENTLVWGEGLMDWIPIKNVSTLVGQIRSPQVRAATWLKKKLVMEPQYRQVRRRRARQGARTWTSSQVKDMY